MGKKELSIKKELARLYYYNNETQKAIAEKIGVSCVTVNKWVKEEEWEAKRAAKFITRQELVAKMLKKINEKLESGQWTADEMVKATTAIEKLDKQTNVVTIMEVFTKFDNWLVSRMQFDTELTPELVNQIHRYHDLFISEQLKYSTVEFK
jgi:uncharacterized protein YjcR